MPTTALFAHPSHFKSVPPRVHRLVRCRTLRRELTMQNVGQHAIKVEIVPASAFARGMSGLI
jgi:hypothetical protein